MFDNINIQKRNNFVCFCTDGGSMKNYRDLCIDLLQERGVSLHSIAEVARYLQAEYHENLQAEQFYSSIYSVLDKREVQFAVMVAIEMDMQAENRNLFNKELEEILLRDEPLFGVDEVNAYGITNLYGSIALTNFGYIDKFKYGIISEINARGKDGSECHTFLDDVVGAIAAAAASRFAHGYHKKDEPFEE